MIRELRKIKTYKSTTHSLFFCRKPYTSVTQIDVYLFEREKSRVLPRPLLDLLTSCRTWGKETVRHPCR